MGTAKSTPRGSAEQDVLRSLGQECRARDRASRVHYAASAGGRASRPAQRGLTAVTPDSAVRTEDHPDGRSTRTVRISSNDVAPWPAGRTMGPHRPSYSDTAMLEAGTIGVVSERGDPASTQLVFCDQRIPQAKAPRVTGVRLAQIVAVW